jgi:hypothetical protein
MTAWRCQDKKHIKSSKGESKMNKQHLRHIVWAIAILILAGCAIRPVQLPAPQVPDALMVSPGEQVAVSMFAEGVQIYQCKANEQDATKMEWAFKAPEAFLYDNQRNELGKHYAGPTWEANDGSKVIGEVKARADAPTPGTIPWLLLNAKSTEGMGTFGAVTSIHRVDTTGGSAPQDGCDLNHQGEEMRVPYTANYYFYTSH